jgi:hypothetical protein
MLCPVNKEHVSGNQIRFNAQLSALTPNLLQRLFMMPPELGDGLMIRF